MTFRQIKTAVCLLLQVNTYHGNFGGAIADAVVSFMDILCIVWINVKVDIYVHHKQ